MTDLCRDAQPDPQDSDRFESRSRRTEDVLRRVGV